ncbi:hypothetical protein N7G274_008622 [Stereocaulon virgatum]|uniref:Xaa-Pro aminopeptidase n=1 Tax=Stereocaulon virgatum TaxID=373712 RepID=A0ABR3ZZB1_9LECA
MAQSDFRITLSGGGVKKYPAKLHARNVARHLGVSEGLIFLPGQHMLYIEDSDMFYPFRQRKQFYYMSGVNELDCYMTYDIEKDHSILYIPPVTLETKVWFGKGFTVEEARERYDFDTVILSTCMREFFHHWFRHNIQKKVYILHKDQSLHGIIDSSIQPNYDTSSLLPALETSRIIKDHDEITAIRHAIKISSIAHRTILHHITTLKSEAEVHAFYLDVCIAHGTQLQAYPPIVGSGSNASVLHYFDNNDSLKGKSLVCMDAGAEWECYASDITRTFPLAANGWPSKETAEIYALVEEMQERCIAMLGPGVRYVDAFFLANRIATEGLMSLGIFKGEDVEEVLESQVIRTMFPHGLGHHLGLDVHDVRSINIFEHNSRGRRVNDEDFRMQHAPCTKEAALLEPGMVVTVEPGIYFNEFALKGYLEDSHFAKYIDEEVLDRYMHVGGVRIEDDILITKDGYENLTLAPKGKEMLDIIRDGARCKHGEECKNRGTSIG